MHDLDHARRRADSPVVAGKQLVLYTARGEIARIAVVADQLDDHGLRGPLVEDVLSAFPHAELHVVEDHRSEAGAPILGRAVTRWGPIAAPRRGLFRRQRTTSEARGLFDCDVLIRIGDRRSRGFVVRPDTLDLTYILALDGGPETKPGEASRLGPTLEDRCALQAADVVWCASRWIMATLRRRWNVDAGLLYPGVELPAAAWVPGHRNRIVAAAGTSSPAWEARLATLSSVRRDLEVVLHGEPSPRSRRRNWRVEPETPEALRSLLPDALALVMPPNDAFDPRSVWAQQAGVPIIAPMRSAAAETVEGLERRAPTGVLLDELTDEALLDAVQFVERHGDLFAPTNLAAQGQRWSRERFRGTLKSMVFDAWCAHLGRLERGPTEARTDLSHVELPTNAH